MIGSKGLSRSDPAKDSKECRYTSHCSPNHLTKTSNPTKKQKHKQTKPTKTKTKKGNRIRTAKVDQSCHCSHERIIQKKVDWFPEACASDDQINKQNHWLCQAIYKLSFIGAKKESATQTTKCSNQDHLPVSLKSQMSATFHGNKGLISKANKSAHIRLG